MDKEKALEMLADLLQGTTQKDYEGIDDPEKVIELVLKQMRKNPEKAPIAKEVKTDVKEIVSEEDGETPSEITNQDDDDNPKNTELPDYYMGTGWTPFWDYNYGLPRYLPRPVSVKDWWTIKDLDLDEFVDADYDYEDDRRVKIIDTDYDLENGIRYKDIALWINSLTNSQLLDITFEPDEMNDLFFPISQFQYIDNDYYDIGNFEDDELAELDEAITRKIGKVENITEVLDMQARLRKAMKMRAKAKIIAMKRKIALKKHATLEQIQARARRLARNMLKSKFAGGKPYDELSYSDKMRVEKVINSRPTLVKALTTKMIPVVRKLERERFEHKVETTE